MLFELADEGLSEARPNMPDLTAEAKWAARLVGAGSLLTLLYQVGYLILDRDHLSLSHPRILILHLICIGLFAAAGLMTLHVGSWMRSHWKWVAFSFSAIMIATMTCIAILTRQTQALFIALILFLAGTGPFLSWREKIQALLSVVAFGSVGVVVCLSGGASFNGYELLGLVIASAIGLFSTALERRLRRARWRAEEKMLEGRETLLRQERVRLVGQLASGIAHDLNNCLNVVKLRLDGLAHDDLVQSRHAARLQALGHAIEDASRTVARVRDLGKTRGPEENVGEAVQLCELVAQAIDLARSSIEGRTSLRGGSIKITSRIPDRLPAVRGLASDLRQVFLNLLLNASDAVEACGEVTLESSVEDDWVVVRVADNGPGIAAEHIGKVFEPFFTTKGPRGAGLGLATSRAIMDGIGGSICAANRPGGGAMFVLRFPPAANGTGESRPQQFNEPTRGCCFLLVDDDAENLASLSETLVRRGHQVDTALSGAMALEKLSSDAVYDVILCDLGMPGMNGWEVARRAREMDRGSNFYIVTGWGPEIEGRIPVSVSVSGVLSKPIDLNEIARIAAHALNQRYGTSLSC